MGTPAGAPRPRWLIRATIWLALIAPVLLGASYGGISLLSAEMLTRSHLGSPMSLQRIDPRRVSRQAEPWAVRTEDGLTLRGWYYPRESHRALVVLVHGLRESWYEVAALGRDLHRRGYDVLLFDLRGHGHSDRSRITMGRRERRDLRAVLRWAKAQGFTADRIGWVGYSMGASTLLMEGAENHDIRLAVIDSPYGNLPEILDAQLALHSNLPRWFNPGILAAANLAFGVRTDDLIPIRSARSWRDRPLLLIHGEADSIVPVHQARQLARAAGSMCRTAILPGVEHVQAYHSDPAGYVGAVDAFFRRYLESPDGLSFEVRPAAGTASAR
jgi:alpha-beta hydrolase superfamily lysophospholipase